MQVRGKMRALFLRKICISAFAPCKFVPGCMLLNCIYRIFFEFRPVALSPCFYCRHVQRYLHLPDLVFDAPESFLRGFTSRDRLTDVVPNGSSILRMQAPQNGQMVFRVIRNLVGMFKYRSCCFPPFGPSTLFSSAWGLAISRMLVGIAASVLPPVLSRPGSRVPSPISYHTFVSAMSIAILRKLQDR